MKYDFISIIDRHNMDAIAVDGLGVGEMSPSKPKEGFDVIPMWVADMRRSLNVRNIRHMDILRREKNISSLSLTGR